jgi:hypothetical protein
MGTKTLRDCFAERPRTSTEGDANLEARKRSQLDRLYQRVVDDLDASSEQWA